MYKYTLVRQFYNENGVFGELRCPDSTHCATVEKLQVPDDWQKMSATQKARYCIPKGEYPMKYKYDENLNLVFVVKGVSSWKNLTFVPNRITTLNQIAIGKTLTQDGRLKDGEMAVEEISGFLGQLYEEGAIPTMPKYGYFTLEIVEAPDYEERPFSPNDEDDFAQMVEEEDEFV